MHHDEQALRVFAILDRHHGDRVIVHDRNEGFVAFADASLETKHASEPGGPTLATFRPVQAAAGGAVAGIHENCDVCATSTQKRQSTWLC